MEIRRRSFLACLGATWASDGETRSALDPDGAVVLRGRRTFPLALYHVPELGSRTAGLRAAREAGFDVVHCAVTREALDAVAAHGLGAWCSVGSISAARAGEDRRRIEETVRRLGDHPALLYWETEDEPSFQWNKPGVPRVSPEAIRETYALLRRLDPTRLVYLNHSPTNLVPTLQQYNPGGDLIATDVYPVVPQGIRLQYALWPDGRQGDLANPYISQVGKYADKMRAVAGSRRAVLMVLQAFAWEMLRKEGDRDPKMVLYPTAEQIRFMACQSIVHGVNGLAWWGLRFTPPESGLWKALAGVAGLLRGLGEVLLALPSPAAVELEYHDTGHSLDLGVEWRAWAVGRQMVWMAVNADPNPVAVTVRGLPAALEVVSGDRPERVPAGWRVRFPPFGTAVWRAAGAA